MRVWVHLIDVRIHWGFSVRTFPGSAAQQSYLILPPTTILGALAYGLTSTGFVKSEVYEKDGIIHSAAIKLIEEFWPIYATVELRDPTIAPPRSLQMIKYLSAFYRAWLLDVETKIQSLKLAELRSPIGVGYTVAPTATLRVAIIATREIPREALWSIVRLGSRESLASVLNVSIVKAEVSKPQKGIIETRFAFPYEVISGEGIRSSNYIRETIPFPITRDEWVWVYALTPKPGRPPLREVIMPIGGDPVKLDGSQISAFIVPVEDYTLILPQGVLQ